MATDVDIKAAHTYFVRLLCITVHTLVAIQAGSSTLLVVKAAGAIPPDGLNQNMLEPKQTPSLQPDAGTGTADYGAKANTSGATRALATRTYHRSSSTSRHEWYYGGLFFSCERDAAGR